MVYSHIVFGCEYVLQINDTHMNWQNIVTTVYKALVGYHMRKNCVCSIDQLNLISLSHLYIHKQQKSNYLGRADNKSASVRTRQTRDREF